jgi:hypothetical protein
MADDLSRSVFLNQSARRTLHADVWQLLQSIDDADRVGLRKRDLSSQEKP